MYFEPKKESGEAEAYIASHIALHIALHIAQGAEQGVDRRSLLEDWSCGQYGVNRHWQVFPELWAATSHHRKSVKGRERVESETLLEHC